MIRGRFSWNLSHFRFREVELRCFFFVLIWKFKRFSRRRLTNLWIRMRLSFYPAVILLHFCLAQNPIKMAWDLLRSTRNFQFNFMVELCKLFSRCGETEEAKKKLTKNKLNQSNWTCDFKSFCYGCSKVLCEWSPETRHIEDEQKQSNDKIKTLIVSSSFFFSSTTRFSTWQFHSSKFYCVRLKWET